MTKRAINPFFQLRNLAVCFALILFLHGFARAQSLPEARRETLLNGLRLILWPRAGDDKVLLKLRIHSGSSFDLAGKTGATSLLADSLFSDVATREAVEKDLGGRLNVAVTHDWLEITLSGDTASFEELVSVLRSALLNPTPEPEKISALRDARLKLLKANPPLNLDQLALARFFGHFPYSRPSAGLANELAKVDRPDLLFLRERFHNPNNATLVIAGNFEPNRAFRVTRQLLGGWRKSDVVIPSSFRQPETPDERVLLVNQPDASEAEIRLILRGASRNDRDYLALALLTDIARSRWQAALPELPPGYLNVRQEARALPGFVLLSGKIGAEDSARAFQTARAALASLANEGPTPAEFERARAALAKQLNEATATVEGVATIWLDADTYRLPLFADQLRALNNLNVNDLKKAATRLFQAVNVAGVASGPADKMRPGLEKTAKVEIYGETTAPKAQPTPPAKSVLAKP